MADATEEEGCTRSNPCPSCIREGNYPPRPPQPPTLTDEELAGLEASVGAATPGPWFVDRGGDFDDPYYSIPGVCRDKYGDNSLMVGSDRATADFIAAARADVPRLIAALRASRAENEKLSAELERCYYTLTMAGVELGDYGEPGEG